MGTDERVRVVLLALYPERGIPNLRFCHALVCVSLFTDKKGESQWVLH